MNKLNTLTKQTSKEFLLDVTLCLQKPFHRVPLQIPSRLYDPFYQRLLL